MSEERPGRKVFLLAQNTFRGLTRRRSLTILFVFAVTLIISSAFFGFLPLTEERKFVLDMGLACVSLFSVLFAVFAAALIPAELQSKSAQLVFSKPVSRFDFIAGNLLGSVAFVSLVYFMMSLAFVCALAVKGIPVDFRLSAVLAAGLFEPIVISAIAIFASTVFTSPAVTTAFVFFIYILGHLNATLAHLSEHSPRFFKAFGTLASLAIPNLEVFNLRQAILAGTAVSAVYILKSFLLALTYSAAFCFLSVLTFSRREF